MQAKGGDQGMIIKGCYDFDPRLELLGIGGGELGSGEEVSPISAEEAEIIESSLEVAEEYEGD